MGAIAGAQTSDVIASEHPLHSRVTVLHAQTAAVGDVLHMYRGARDRAIRAHAQDLARRQQKEAESTQRRQHLQMQAQRDASHALGQGGGRDMAAPLTSLARTPALQRQPASKRARHPIIIVPSAPSALITLLNAGSFLGSSRFVLPTDAKRDGARRSKCVGVPRYESITKLPCTRSFAPRTLGELVAWIFRSTPPPMHPATHLFLNFSQIHRD